MSKPIFFDAMTTQELRSLGEQIAAEIALREGAPANPARLTIDRGSYNERRYGRPWIGKIVEWSAGRAPEIKFGAYLGGDSGGTLEVYALPGDIIRHGQTDLRNPKGTRSSWAIIQPDGTYTETDQATAREHWIATH